MNLYEPVLILLALGLLFLGLWKLIWVMLDLSMKEIKKRDR